MHRQVQQEQSPHRSHPTDIASPPDDVWALAVGTTAAWTSITTLALAMAPPRSVTVNVTVTAPVPWVNKVAVLRW